MSTHEYDDNMRADNEFIKGDLSFLVKGNKCRLLDGRRTTGYIEKYDEDSAMFRWKITKYEDKGKHWDLPAESVTKFQFEKESEQLSDNEVNIIKEKIKKYKENLYIKAKESEKIKTEAVIAEREKEIKKWLKDNSMFFKSNKKLNFDSKEGPSSLTEDLTEYMKLKGLYDIERKTAETMVLNPKSGEWIRGMEIMLGEMGLVSYKGKIPRTKGIFTGLGSKNKRYKYLVHRLAFVRAYFNLLKIKEIVIYRGMSNEKDWKVIPRTFLYCTLSYDVAKDFSDFNRESKYRTSYIIKMTCSVKKLFMTYIETQALNRQYKEAEAILLYDRKITI